MEPIATYEETRLEGRRSFRLYADRVVVSFRSGAKDGDMQFELSILSPIVSRVRARPGYFKLGLLLIAVPWFWHFVSDTPYRELVIPASISFVGFVIAAVSFRKVEFASFSTTAGITAWDVAKAGKMKHEFDQFVSLVIEQIQIATGRTDNCDGLPPD